MPRLTATDPRIYGPGFLASTRPGRAAKTDQYARVSLVGDFVTAIDDVEITTVKSYGQAMQANRGRTVNPFARSKRTASGQAVESRVGGGRELSSTRLAEREVNGK
jgi:hypothetical protein